MYRYLRFNLLTESKLVQNHLKSVQAVKGTASTSSVVLCLFVFVLCQGQV